MNIVIVHNTYQEPGGDDIVFRNECELLKNAWHEVVQRPRGNDEAEQFVSIRRLALAKRTIWASDTRREFRQSRLRERPRIVTVYNASFRRATRSHLDSHVPRTPSI